MLNRVLLGETCHVIGMGVWKLQKVLSVFRVVGGVENSKVKNDRRMATDIAVILKGKDFSLRDSMVSGDWNYGSCFGKAP